MKSVVSKKGYLIIFSIFLAFFGLFRVANAQSGSAVLVTLDPATANIVSGQSFDVGIKVNAGSYDLSAIEFRMNFDKDRLEVVSIDLPASGELTNEFIKDFDNTAGTITLATGRPPSKSGAFGEKTVAKVTFKAKSSQGDASLVFTKAAATASLNYTNLIPSLPEGGVYTIGQGNISPSPSANSVYFLTNPNSGKKNYGEEFDIQVKLNGRDYNVAAVDFKITVQNLEIKGFTPDKSKLSDEFIKDINNLDGTLRYSAGRSPSGRASGEINVGTLRVKSIADPDASPVSATASATPAIATAIFSDIEVTSSSPVGSLPIGDNLNARFELGKSVAQETAFYWIAETEEEFNNLKDEDKKPYQYTDFEKTVVRFPYTFKDDQSGKKFVYVKFQSTTGEIRNTRKEITLLDPDPKITKLQLKLSPAGGTTATITGVYFGEQGDKSMVKIGGKEAEVIEWIPLEIGNEPLRISDTTESSPSASEATSSGLVQGVARSLRYYQIKAKVSDTLTQKIPIEVTVQDGRKANARGSIDLVDVDFMARRACVSSGMYSVDNVEITTMELARGAKKVKAKVRLDKDGRPDGFSPLLQKGATYELLVKAPGALAKKSKFTAEEGTVVLNGGSPIELPVGDIAPKANPDGVINSVDKAELFRQWINLTDTTKTGDLNGDSRVNSIDYSCLLRGFNQGDDRIVEQR